MSPAIEPVLIDGRWSTSECIEETNKSFRALNPSTGGLLPPKYPISSWADIDRALKAAQKAASALTEGPPERIADFLVAYGRQIEKQGPALAAQATLETGLPEKPRLLEKEIPRTVDQLFQAAKAVLNRSWKIPRIDRKSGIRSQYEPLAKPVVIFGPNNFPFAFSSISGGDFAAAIGAGNPVIAKGHPLHPGTTKMLAQLALEAATLSKLPPATVQMFHHCSREDGFRLVSDARVGAIAFTGSRRAGLPLKFAADRAGIPIYLEMGSLNPVVILPGALEEALDEIVAQLVDAALMAAGQYCTNPGLVLLVESPMTESFIEYVAAEYDTRNPSGVMLSEQVLDDLNGAVEALVDAGAEIVAGGERIAGTNGFRYQNTLLRLSGESFLAAPDEFQREAFGNCTLCVVIRDDQELTAIIEALEGNLAGSIYSSRKGSDEASVRHIAPRLLQRVGRILNDKMPPGVAVVPSMVHGGPYPATGHPGFTAVGVPASMRRFARPICYDNVRADRLPTELRDLSPIRGLWRCIDGHWQKTPG